MKLLFRVSLLTLRRRSKIYFATLALLLRESARPCLRPSRHKSSLDRAFPSNSNLDCWYRNYNLELAWVTAFSKLRNPLFPVCVDSNSYNHRHLLFLRIAPRYKCRHSHQTLSKLSARAPRFPCPRLPPIRRNFLTRRGLVPILGAPRADGLRERCAAVAWVQNAVANKLDPDTWSSTLDAPLLPI